MCDPVGGSTHPERLLRVELLRGSQQQVRLDLAEASPPDESPSQRVEAERQPARSPAARSRPQPGPLPSPECSAVPLGGHRRRAARARGPLRVVRTQPVPAHRSAAAGRRQLVRPSWLSAMPPADRRWLRAGQRPLWRPHSPRERGSGRGPGLPRGCPVATSRQSASNEGKPLHGGEFPGRLRRMPRQRPATARGVTSLGPGATGRGPLRPRAARGDSGRARSPRRARSRPLSSGHEQSPSWRRRGIDRRAGAARGSRTARSQSPTRRRKRAPARQTLHPARLGHGSALSEHSWCSPRSLHEAAALPGNRNRWPGPRRLLRRP